MCEQRLLGTIGLACLLLVTGPAVGTGHVYAEAPVPICGEISGDNGHFEPIAQDGNVVIFLHEDVHELTGDVQGEWSEVGLLTLDLSTGAGFFFAVGEFDGAVLGETGTATLKVHGEVRDFFVTDRGYFVITHGEDGLAGVHASGTYSYIVGAGGRYDGSAHFDERR